MDSIYWSLVETMARGARRVLTASPSPEQHQQLQQQRQMGSNNNNKNNKNDVNPPVADNAVPQDKPADNTGGGVTTNVESAYKEPPTEATPTTVATVDNSQNEYVQGATEPAATANQDEHQQQVNTTSSNNQDQAQHPQETTRIELVKLVPFDVKLVSQSDNSNVELNAFALTDLVTDWMDEALAVQVDFAGWDETTHSVLDSVILEERGISNVNMGGGQRRHNLRGLQSNNLVSYTIASYEGVSLWKHTTPSSQQVVTASDVEGMERQALLRDDRLLELLQASSAQGLGNTITEVRAYINPHPLTTGDAALQGSSTNGGSSANANLELIIVVAIVVACMAFAFLIFSLFWAWRFDQRRRGANANNSLVDCATTGAMGGPDTPVKKPHMPTRSPDGTGVTDESDYEFDQMQHMTMDLKSTTQSSKNSKRNVQEFQAQVESNKNHDDNEDDSEYENYTLPSTLGGGGLYPESVISEDISTSLSAYYRSGMGRPPVLGNNSIAASGIVDSGSIMLGGTGGKYNDFDDQASFSSMESYGYSLDGYAPSLGGNTYTNNANSNNLGDRDSLVDPDDDGLDDIIKR